MVDSYIKGYRNQAEVISLCEVCNNYNNLWTCPPFLINTSSVIKNHDNLIILVAKVVIDPKLISSITSKEEVDKYARLIFNQLRQDIDNKLIKAETIYKNSLAFYAGCCCLCSENNCTKNSNLPCRHPGLMRYSLEAFGFDISKTLIDLFGIELKWGSTDSLPEYYTYVSALFSNQVIEEKAFIQLFEKKY